jgi:hypothetical protein
VPSWTNRAVLPGGHAAEQLSDLEPQQRDEGLAAGVGQVRSPARDAGAEHPVFVDPDDGADRGALGAFKADEGVVKIGGAEALLGEQGPGLRAVGRVEPVARLLQQALHVGAPSLSRPPAARR